MNEFLQQFLLESREFAEEAAAGLLVLEKSPQDAEQLDAVFRAFHTLKGGAGIVGFSAMERAAHAVEDLLSAARGRRQVLDAVRIGHCLACLDQVLQWLDTIEQTGDLPSNTSEGEAERIVARIGGLLESSSAVEPIAMTQRVVVATNLPIHVRDVLAAQLELISEGSSAASPGYATSAARSASNALRSAGRSADADAIAGLLASFSAAELTSRLNRALMNVLATADTNIVSPTATPHPAAPGVRPDTAARTLRIDAARIDALVRLTGELTIAKNAAGHLAKIVAAEGNPLAPTLKRQHATFEHLISELQRAVLGMRVLPLRVVFQRFPRVLREISASLGKPAAMTFAGEDTEADKAIVEILFEPLLHVVRNALDHGVESPAQRASLGKPAIAGIAMRGMRQGDRVVVEVTDDGGGIDTDRIRSVALKQGLATEESLGAMSDSEIIDLVFAPGFSTSATVTELSGRGVGMDAVRVAIERVGGRVSLHSQAGLGTTVRLTLPFSVMMTKVMSVEAGGQMFGVPLDSVVETIRVPRNALAAIGAARAVVVRDQTIPVFELTTMLGVPVQTDDTSDAILVITTFAGQRCALDVDALGDRMEVILKPLDGLLAGTPGITGTTVLGDGRVLLILDIGDLLQ